MRSFYIKTNRVFTPLRRWAWIFTLLVGIGGLWYPSLGILVFGIIAGLIITSFLKGRYWCGNFCPHGSLFDHIFTRFSRNGKIPAFFKSKIVVVGFFAWFGFNLTRKFIKVSALWGTMKFWDRLGFIFVASYLMVLIVGGIVNTLFNPRTWCNFCPMGSLQRLSYKLGKLLGVNKKTDQKVTIASTEMCHTCGKCARVCPMQLNPYLDFSDKNQFDNEVCIRCKTCVVNCPAGILSLDNEETATQITKQTNISGYENRQKIISRIERIEKLQDDVLEVTFRFIKPVKVSYQAGQFILVKIQDHPKMYRAYSISSYNEDDSRLSVTIKEVSDGYGTGIIFDKFKVGDQIELEGPMGHELIVDRTTNKVLLVAGGIGITPFKAIVKDLLENEHQIQEFKLIYGVNRQNEFLYNNEFKEMEEQDARFEYIQVVAFDDQWSGNKGFVTDVMSNMSLSDYKIYMCGPKPMIDASLHTLERLGVDKEKIFYESA